VELLILLGCILLFLLPTAFLFYRKPKKKLVSAQTEIKTIKEKKTHAYIYAIKHDSYDWDVYKVGKTSRSPRDRMRDYETSHQTPPRYVLLYKINVKSKLTKAENELKSFFRASGRLAIETKVRKEMFRFDNLQELHSEVSKVLAINKIGFVDLLAAGEYDSTGKDLKRGNNY
jgi:hypothetical protein